MLHPELPYALRMPRSSQPWSMRLASNSGSRRLSSVLATHGLQFGVAHASRVHFLDLWKLPLEDLEGVGQYWTVGARHARRWSDACLNQVARVSVMRFAPAEHELIACCGFAAVSVGAAFQSCEGHKNEAAAHHGMAGRRWHCCNMLERW